ncbi:MAG: TerC family protein [Lacipirellulaceae bacterium]
MPADFLPIATLFLGQDMAWGDLGVVGLLVLLEGVLSIDNALVLGILAKRLPKEQRSKALTYGLVGAFVFRFIAVLLAAYLLQWRWVKLLGGGYLMYIALKHLLIDSRTSHNDATAVEESDGEIGLVDEATGEPLTPEQEKSELEERLPAAVLEQVAGRESATKYARFWPTVLVIELTDIAFAVDSILAAMALVGSPPPGHPTEAPHPKLWVIVLGGILGIVLMRFAAVLFIRLLERFPRFEEAAYLLVAVIGAKLLADWGFNSAEHPHVVDFHDWRHPAFWAFWVSMASCFAVGFLPKKRAAAASR